jgi:hypothetical protein
MRGKSSVRIWWVLLLNLVVGVAFAGGRYEDPPMNLVEVQKFSQQALDALKAGNKDAALESTKQGRKLAVESYKEKSTMPMQVASGSLKSAIAALEGGNLTEATTEVEHALAKLNEEVDYYKKSGKIK